MTTRRHYLAQYIQAIWDYFRIVDYILLRLRNRDQHLYE